MAFTEITGTWDKIMKTILFLTNIMPFPGNSGGTIKTRKLIDGLVQKGYRVILCFLDVNTEDKTAYWRNLYSAKLAGFYRVFNDRNVRSVSNMCRSIICGKPLNVYRNYVIEFTELVNRLVKENEIDVIIADHLEMFQYVPQSYYKKTILHEHNAEYVIWKRYSDTRNNYFLKEAALYESNRIKRYELSACQKSAVVLAAPADNVALSGVEKNDKYLITYHMADDTLLELPQIIPPKEFNILFVGTLSWDANSEGVEWFANNVFPIIKKKYPEVRFRIIGRSNRELRIKNHENIECLGFVESLDEYYADATCFVCPLFWGAGMKVKILEAMYRGIPFVTTNVGAESIILKDQRETFSYPYAGIIANSLEEFAQAVISLYEDSEKWLSISKTERLIARKEYRWNDEIDRFEKAIRIVTGE